MKGFLREKEKMLNLIRNQKHHKNRFFQNSRIEKWNIEFINPNSLLMI